MDTAHSELELLESSRELVGFEMPVNIARFYNWTAIRLTLEFVVLMLAGAFFWQSFQETLRLSFDQILQKTTIIREPFNYVPPVGTLINNAKCLTFHVNRPYIELSETSSFRRVANLFYVVVPVDIFNFKDVAQDISSELMLDGDHNTMLKPIKTKFQQDTTVPAKMEKSLLLTYLVSQQDINKQLSLVLLSAPQQVHVRLFDDCQLVEFHKYRPSVKGGFK